MIACSGERTTVVRPAGHSAARRSAAACSPTRGADHRDGDLDVRLSHALLGAQAEVDLVGQRDGEGILLERRAVFAGVRLDGRKTRLVVSGYRTGELGGPERRVAGGLVVEPA